MSKHSSHRFFKLRLIRICLWALLILFLVPSLQLLAYRWIDPPFTGLMLERHFGENGGRVPLHHYSVNLERVSRNMVFAAIASEDQNFLEHGGFDLEAIGKAMKYNRRNRHKRGASTISQQTAKNVFLWEERSWVRKGLELPLTLGIEAFWRKRRILEVYLNVVELGPGVFGVEAASQYWFHVPARRLSLHQAAL
ncbi:MAG TPA: monofunctional biosynthetic peptidoglycan transglycosylase, partial [Fibrobacteraceae bacterium]|nr:monofunctional biosynthetic peptidoglycan transglycosylase [Fibrobacteraceae bacterium]